MAKNTYRDYSYLLLLLFFIIFPSCHSSSQQEKHQQKSNLSIEDGWVSLFNGETLSGWKISNFGSQGSVHVSNKKITLGMGDGCTGITWTKNFPKINYEVKLEAKKISGNDFFCGITFPVNDSFCSLIIGGWGGPVVGLSNIDGIDASENQTSKLKKFEHNKWYTIHLKVTSKNIIALIDEEKIINLNTAGKKLSIRPEVYLSKPFGICSWNTSSALKNIQLRTY